MPRKTATPASRLPRSTPAAIRTLGRDPDGSAAFDASDGSDGSDASTVIAGPSMDEWRASTAGIRVGSDTAHRPAASGPAPAIYR
ncbi:hypothetical protein [Embleya sp. NPDC001921]